LPSELLMVGGQPGPGAELARRAESRDVADLRDHEHRGVAADAADLAEHVDARVMLGQSVDLAGGHPDLAIEVTD
jgi:hypothetical protein